MIKNMFKKWRAFVFCNVATGIHSGQVTCTLESAVSTRYLLGTNGSSVSQVDICGASDLPLGVITDEGSIGDLVNVSLPGSASTTVLMVASEAIAIGDAVYAAANGKVQDEPASAGTYYQVGTAMSASTTDGDLIEVDPVEPRKTVVLSAFTGTAATDVAAIGAALEIAPDKLIVLVS